MCEIWTLTKVWAFYTDSRYKWIIKDSTKRQNVSLFLKNISLSWKNKQSYFIAYENNYCNNIWNYYRSNLFQNQSMYIPKNIKSLIVNFDLQGSSHFVLVKHIKRNSNERCKFIMCNKPVNKPHAVECRWYYKRFDVNKECKSHHNVYIWFHRATTP